MNEPIEKQIEKLINEIFEKLDDSNESKEHDRLVEEFFNYCVEEWRNNKLETMSVVSVLLPKIISGPYQRAVINFMKQITYEKLPPGLSPCEGKFTSTGEHLRSYSYPYYKLPDFRKFEIPKQLSRLEKFEEIEKHTAILCYIPLPGLCTKFSENGVLNALFNYKQSAFVQLIISKPIDYSLNNKPLLALFSSPPLQAIVKFKWHAFGRSSEMINKMVWITSMIWGICWMLFFCRNCITLLLMNAEIKYFLSPLSYFMATVFCLPFVTSFLELNNYFGLDPLQNFGIKSRPYFQAITTYFLWVFFILFLTSTKNFGVFLIAIVQICQRIVWILIFVALNLFIYTHATMVYLSSTDTDESDESLVISAIDNQTSYKIFKKNDMITEGNNTKYRKENNFKSFIESLENGWSMILNDYSSLEPWSKNHSVYVIKFAYSLLLNILSLNVLIAFVIKTYDEVLVDSYTKWTIVRAHIIALIEISFRIPSQDENYFPYTIIYEAADEETEKFHKKNFEDEKKDREYKEYKEHKKNKDKEAEGLPAEIKGQIQKLLVLLEEVLLKKAGQ
ncbi:unnamed protein product [Rhizophagus irregularis]|nr:unnamed protein product [Rhizophagus irregularis]